MTTSGDPKRRAILCRLAVRHGMTELGKFPELCIVAVRDFIFFLQSVYMGDLHSIFNSMRLL